MSEQHHNHDIYVPRGALIAAGLLISLAMVAVASFRIAGLDPTAQIPNPDQSIVTRQLRFEDSTNGIVIVHEVRDGSPDRVVHEIQSGEGNFIRGVLRSLTRSRRASGIGQEYPFLLKLQTNGSVLLEDPKTGQIIDLRAFGPTNIEAFRMLLNADIIQ